MILQMLTQFLFLFAPHRRFPPAQMKLRLQRSLLPVLADEFPNHTATDAKPRGQNRVASFFLQISGHNPFPQIH